MAIASFFSTVETPFSFLFSLLTLLPLPIFDYGLTTTVPFLCRWWVVKSDYESFKVGWTWWLRCCSFLVMGMRGLDLVAFINFSQWVLGKFSFGLRFFFRGEDYEVWTSL
jgi:hypothetical protein